MKRKFNCIKNLLVCICFMLCLLFVPMGATESAHSAVATSEGTSMDMIQKSVLNEVNDGVVAQAENASGIVIQAVKQTAANATTVDVSIPLSHRDFSMMRYVEIDVCNTQNVAIPFSIVLEDKIGMKTRGFGFGAPEESLDCYSLTVANSDISYEARAYYGCVWIPEGFVGTVALPYTCFKIIQDFDLTYHPAVTFDYRGVEALTISIDQFNNPNFSIEIMDVRLVTPKESLTVREGQEGATGVSVRSNQADEAVYTTVTDRTGV